MKYIFQENQKFTQWWVWACILVTVVSLAISVNNIYTVLFIVFFIIFFYFLELRIKVTREELQYQFFPMHYRKYSINKNEIEKIEALKYKPLGDYGGWGIRYAFKGKCYNVKGNLGVKVFLKNGSYVLFGSQKNKELEKALKQIIQQ